MNGTGYGAVKIKKTTRSSGVFLKIGRAVPSPIQLDNKIVCLVVQSSFAQQACWEECGYFNSLVGRNAVISTALLGGTGAYERRAKSITKRTCWAGNAQERPRATKNARREPKNAQECPKSAPRAPRERPKSVPRAPSSAQNYGKNRKL